MTDYRSARSRDLVPYVAGEQPDSPDIVKLNTNENAYPPSPLVLEAIQGAADALRLYPPTDGGILRAAVARRHGLRNGQVFCGNGSDEVLALAYLAFFGQDRPLCSPALTYSFYPVYAQIFGVPYLSVPMKDGLFVDVDALIAADRAVALANPNAPTTATLAKDEVRRIAQALNARGQLLMLDEAYADFAPEDCVSLIAEFDNLLIVRTMSKSYSLAGLRVGYALGDEALIDALICVKDCFNSYPLDRLAIAGGAAALNDAEYFQKTRDAVVSTRERFAAGLRKLGFALPDSGANFVFAMHPRASGKALFLALRERNIVVRHFDKPSIAEYLRISIGTDAQMDAVLAALGDILSTLEEKV